MTKRRNQVRPWGRQQGQGASVQRARGRAEGLAADRLALWPCVADGKEGPSDVRVYDGQGVTTTVTTMALDSGPESSEEEDDEEQEDYPERHPEDMMPSSSGAPRALKAAALSAAKQHQSKRQAKLHAVSMKRKPKGEGGLSKTAQMVQRLHEKASGKSKPTGKRKAKEERPRLGKKSRGRGK